MDSGLRLLILLSTAILLLVVSAVERLSDQGFPVKVSLRSPTPFEVAQEYDEARASYARWLAEYGAVHDDPGLGGFLHLPLYLDRELANLYLEIQATDQQVDWCRYYQLEGLPDYFTFVSRPIGFNEVLVKTLACNVMDGVAKCARRPEVSRRAFLGAPEHYFELGESVSFREAAWIIEAIRAGVVTEEATGRVARNLDMPIRTIHREFGAYKVGMSTCGCSGTATIVQAAVDRFQLREWDGLCV